MSTNQVAMAALETAEPCLAPGDEAAPTNGLVLKATCSDVTVPAGVSVEEPMLLRTIGQLVRNKGLASIGDQVLVSATNFITTVIIARAAGQDALGTYSLAFSVMLILLCTQESLICQPYTIGHRRLDEISRRTFAGSTLVQALLFSLVLLIVASAISMHLARHNWSLTRLAFVICIAAPFVLLRDFARRMSMAHLLVSRAIVVDAVVLVVQLGGLLILWRIGSVSAETAYLVIAGACAISSIIWLWSFRQNFSPPGDRVKDDAARGWSFGRWVLGSQVLSVMSTYLIYWFVAARLGTEASGIMAACSAIILLSNPIVFGTCTYLVPRLAAAVAEEGNAGVLRVAVRATIFLAVVMSIFCVAAFVAGDVFLYTVYGSKYVGYNVVSGLFGISALELAIGSAPDYILWVKHRPALSFWTGLLGLSCISALAVCLIPVFGLVGAVSAIAIGNGITALVRWVTALRLIHAQPLRVTP